MFSQLQFLERLRYVMFASPLAVPIWAAILMLALAIFRGPIIEAIFRIFRITDEQLKKDVGKKIDAPLQLLLLLLAFSPFAYLIQQPLGAFIVVLIHVACIFLLFHILIQAVDLGIFAWYLSRKQAAVSAVVRYFILGLLYAVTILVVLDWGFGVSILPLLATSTVITAVLGLALQDTLKNAFAGLNMSLEHSFEQGDWISFRMDSNYEFYGQIIEIGWRTTKIKTLNNNYAVIPNSSFTSHELINYNRPSPTHSRTVNIPINLRADAAAAQQALVEAAMKIEGVLKDPRAEAFPVEIKSDCVVLQLRFWMNDLAARETLTGEVLQQCWQDLSEIGAIGQAPQAL